MKKAAKSTGASSLEIVPAPTQSEEFSQARIYVNAIRSMMHGAGAMSIVLGAELHRLHKLFCRRPGRPGGYGAVAQAVFAAAGASRKIIPPHCGGIISWEDRLKLELGISETHARRCRELYREAKKRLPAFASIAQELLDTPLRDLPDLRRAELVERTHKLLPFEGLRQLMWEWDVCRGQQGGDNTPRDESGKRIAEPRRTDAQIARDEFTADAELVCARARSALKELLVTKDPETGKIGPWCRLDDAGLRDLKELLIDALDEVRAYEQQRKLHGRKSK